MIKSVAMNCCGLKQQSAQVNFGNRANSAKAVKELVSFMPVRKLEIPSSSEPFVSRIPPCPVGKGKKAAFKWTLDVLTKSAG